MTDHRPTSFDRDVVACKRSLFAFAMKLTRGNRTRSEDMVQDTMLKAFRNFVQFEPGTNLKAWLFTILRNEHLSAGRKSGREVEDVDGVWSSLMKTPADQMDAYDLKIVLGQMDLLSPIQRLSLELIAMDQMSYEEASAILGIPEGTIKSQVSRARGLLLDIYEGRSEALRV